MEPGIGRFGRQILVYNPRWKCKHESSEWRSLADLATLITWRFTGSNPVSETSNALLHETESERMSATMVFSQSTETDRGRRQAQTTGGRVVPEIQGNLILSLRRKRPSVLGLSSSQPGVQEADSLDSRARRVDEGTLGGNRQMRRSVLQLPSKRDFPNMIKIPTVHILWVPIICFWRWEWALSPTGFPIV
jgi:hypothetical protein